MRGSLAGFCTILNEHPGVYCESLGSSGVPNFRYPPELPYPTPELPYPPPELPYPTPELPVPLPNFRTLQNSRGIHSTVLSDSQLTPGFDASEGALGKKR